MNCKTRRSKHVKFVKFTLLEQVEKYSVDVYKTDFKLALTAFAEIIVNLHICAVVKVKLQRNVFHVV